MESCQRYVPVLLLLGFATLGIANDPAAAQPGEPAQQEHLAIELDRPVSDQHIREPVPLGSLRESTSTKTASSGAIGAR